MTDLLFRLPHCLICDVLGNWVGLKSIIRLDSVFVSKCSRETFLDTLKSKELVVTDYDLYTDNFPNHLVEWSVKRRIKFSALAFGFRTCAAVSPPMMQEFLKLNGHTLKSFVMHSNDSLDDTVWLKGLVEDCLALEVLEFEKDGTEVDGFGSLLQQILRKHSKTLRRLDISCGGISIELPVGYPFPDLHEFHPRAGNCIAELDEFLRQCPKLKRMTMSAALCGYHMSFLQTIAMHCPQLNLINLVDLAARVIPEVILLCPRGPALHLHFDPYMEPRDLISIVTTLPNIQSLTLALSKTTHLVLQKIKEHCGNTLRKFSLQECLPFMHTALLELLKSCKNLNILYLNGCCSFTSLQLCQIVRTCPELTSLALLLYPVNDAVLKTISKSLPKLTTLNVEVDDESNRLSTYTLAGINHLLQGCPKLTKFCMGSRYDVLMVDRARTRIKLQYPKLNIWGPEVSGDWFMDNSDEIM